MFIGTNSKARKPFAIGVRGHLNLDIEVWQPIYAMADRFCTHIEEIFFSAREVNR
jgi:hypothetical protein